VPQEMLGSGLPVVELDLETTREIYGKSSAGLRLAAPTPQAIAEALTQVVRASASEQAAMRSSAVALVKDLRWEEAGHVLSRMIEGG
ncbi:MAG: hypothetical protein ACXWPM_11725, partial [Bdellovibrionota bacterium]